MKDSIIITFSGSVIEMNGGINYFIRFFLYNIEGPDGFVWNMPKKPKIEPLYVFICIGGRIRYKCKFVCFENAHALFRDRFQTTMRITGPVERPDHKIEMKGFQGFRYTHELF